MNEDLLISEIEKILQAETGCDTLPRFVKTAIYGKIINYRATVEEHTIKVMQEKLTEALR